ATSALRRGRAGADAGGGQGTQTTAYGNPPTERGTGSSGNHATAWTIQAANRQGRSKIMRILVLGGDGYLGWPTALHLSACGHDGAVADNFARRGYDHELGVDSLVPIETLQTRVAVWREHTGNDVK